MSKRMILWTTLALLALLPALAAAREPGTPREPAKRAMVLAIETPDGRYFIDLFKSLDGPVKIPVRNASVDAILISTSFQKDGSLAVNVHDLTGDLLISPVGHYKVGLGGVRLEDLSGRGLPGWSMRLAVVPVEKLAAGDCSCGSISCDANPGKCISCGGCGSCCDCSQPCSS